MRTPSLNSENCSGSSAVVLHCNETVSGDGENPKSASGRGVGVGATVGKG